MTNQPSARATAIIEIARKYESMGNPPLYAYSDNRAAMEADEIIDAAIKEAVAEATQVERLAVAEAWADRDMALSILGDKLGERDARIKELKEAAKDLDDMILRFAFDGGALDDDTVASIGIDVWGTLKDFRETFGLPPTMSAEGYAKKNGGA